MNPSNSDLTATPAAKGIAGTTVTLTLHFTSPAFLGGADGCSEIRTPPMKSLLRRSWRLAAAASFRYSDTELRKAEGCLLGHAWLKEGNETWAMRSPVSVGLHAKKLKHLERWGPDPRTRHPEVERAPGGMIGSHLYLGYGPLIYQGGTALKTPPALDAGTELELRLHGRGMAKLKTYVPGMLAVMHWVETVGGRGRNGWGSFVLQHVAGDLFNPTRPSEDLKGITRPLRECLGRTWPSAVGSDSHGVLAWSTRQVYRDWSGVMNELARLKIGLRTQFLFQGPGFQPRHVIAYPVTNHMLRRDWPNERLANQLRFKVIPVEGGLRGCVVHVPAGIPEEMIRKLYGGDQQKVRRYEEDVWPKVHGYLDREASRW